MMTFTNKGHMCAEGAISLSFLQKANSMLDADGQALMKASLMQ